LELFFSCQPTGLLQSSEKNKKKENTFLSLSLTKRGFQNKIHESCHFPLFQGHNNWIVVGLCHLLQRILFLGVLVDHPELRATNFRFAVFGDDYLTAGVAVSLLVLSFLLLGS
jgi:hypothetical protein